MEGYKWKAIPKIPKKDQNGPFPEQRDSPVTQIFDNSYFFFTLLLHIENICQKWDSNPRPHSWTRILLLGRVSLLSLAP